MAERTYTAKEVAAMAGLDPSRIRQLLIAGLLRGRKRGGAWFITESDAREWLRGRK